MENKEDYKLLGLYGKQSLIPAFIMLFTHAFTSAYAICSKFTMKGYLELENGQISDFCSGYIYYPTLFLTFLFLSRYFNYFFMKSNYRLLFSSLFSLVIGWVFIVVFRLIFMIILFKSQI